LSPIITTGDCRYSLPHPLIRFFQTSPTYRLSDPSRLLRGTPSIPLNVQSQSLLNLSLTPVHFLTLTPPSLQAYTIHISRLLLLSLSSFLSSLSFLMSTAHSATTIALAAQEQKEHMTQAMQQLHADLTSRDIIVSAHSTPPAHSTTALCTKTVHFIRHGQGFHNLLADMARESNVTWTQFEDSPSNPYTKPEVTDAPLTYKGRLQATSLQATTAALPLDLVVVSPHTRATQTGLIACQHLVTSSTPFICVEDTREESGAHHCDKRRPLSELKLDFPQVDYLLITAEDDPLWTEVRETKAEIGERIYGFLEWLRERKEENVAVATHSGWLMTLFNGAVVCEEEQLKTWFGTGEMRSVTLVWKRKE